MYHTKTQATKKLQTIMYYVMNKNYPFYNLLMRFSRSIWYMGILCDTDHSLILMILFYKQLCFSIVDLSVDVVFFQIQMHTLRDLFFFINIIVYSSLGLIINPKSGQSYISTVQIRLLNLIVIFKRRDFHFLPCLNNEKIKIYISSISEWDNAIVLFLLIDLFEKLL